MQDDLVYSQVDIDSKNEIIIDAIKQYAKDNNQQIYIIKNSLADKKYIYNYNDAMVLLIPRHKIIILNYGDNEEKFNEFVEDFIEDLSSISDKYDFKKVIGRTRAWREKIIYTVSCPQKSHFSIEELIKESSLDDEKDKRASKLLISLLIGSINDANRFKDDIPNNILDKIKQNIILFDSKQTEFIYQQSNNKKIIIQGLSGTGKTELLLHKLKDLYISEKRTKIAFTCYSKVLANDLLHRIPRFFNFMKVEEQIKWNERLWCVGSWGSRNDKDSGIYRYICDYYNIDFFTYGNNKNFKDICSIAINQINNMKEKKYAFDYILIDESQDFDESFFKLCELVTKEKVYIAGDIFQSIFAKNIRPNIEPDFLLKKCYRTDPKTLMFAHGLGMGLFEKSKIRWLKDDDLEACGYLFEKSRNFYILKREPINRFDDIEDIKNINSIELVKCGKGYREIIERIIGLLKDIKEEYPTLLPDDIAIMFPDDSKDMYKIFELLEREIKEKLDWEVNKSYETKEKLDKKIFFSNKNNVKGLEFSFVICITIGLDRSLSFRNTLYMMLTRSFLKTYMLLVEDYNKEVLPDIEQALGEILTKGQMTLKEPTDDEKKKIEENIIKYNSKNSTNAVERICDEMDIPTLYRDKIANKIISEIKKRLTEEELRTAVKSCYELLKISQ